MADIVRTFSTTRLGKWLWQATRGKRSGQVLSDIAQYMRELQHIGSRLRPAHRAHDRAQRRTLARFRAETQRRHRL